MKTEVILILLLTTFLLPTHGQELNQVAIGTTRNERDSIQNILSQEIASAQQKYRSVHDSLRFVTGAIRKNDSLKVTGWSDTLRRRIETKFSPALILRKSDSLRAINLPAERVTGYSDSLLRKKESMMAEVGEKQRNLQEKVTKRYDGWMIGVRERFNLDSAGVKAPALDPAVADPLSKASLPNTSLPTLGGVPSTDLPPTQMPSVPGVPEVPSLNTSDFSSLGLSNDLVKVGGNLAIPSTEQLGNWDKSLIAMPELMGPINDRMAEVEALTTDPGAAAEKAVGQVAEVSDATSALSEADRLKEQNEALKLAEQMKNPESMKEAAVNHFAGQEAALQGAMSQVAKYKQKYASIGSLSEIKKNDWLPRNGLKGRPFRERFRIGLHAGFKSLSDTVLLDFYPNASYRITGRLEAGLGAIYRVRLNTTDVTLDQQDPVWGTSMFVVVKTFKAVHLRFEVDGNSFPKASRPDQPTTRDWRWSFHSGIQTNFKLSKQWTGIIQMLYNFDNTLKDGFPEKLALRFGVQYKLRTKPQQKD